MDTLTEVWLTNAQVTKGPAERTLFLLAFSQGVIAALKAETTTIREGSRVDLINLRLRMMEEMWSVWQEEINANKILSDPEMVSKLREGLTPNKPFDLE